MIAENNEMQKKYFLSTLNSLSTDIVVTYTDTALRYLLLSEPQIAGRRLADQIPLVILYQMVQEFTVQLQREMLQVIQDKEKAESLLEEESGIRAKRINLQNRQERLKKARVLLMDFSMNIYSFSKTQLQC